MSTILHSFKNAEDGTQAEVVAYACGGFIVALRDLDSGDVVPSVKTFATEDAAINYAKSIV